MCTRNLVTEEALTNWESLSQIILIIIVKLIIIINLLKSLELTIHHTRICINLCDICTNFHHNLLHT